MRCITSSRSTTGPCPEDQGRGPRFEGRGSRSQENAARDHLGAEILTASDLLIGVDAPDDAGLLLNALGGPRYIER